VRYQILKVLLLAANLSCITCLLYLFYNIAVYGVIRIFESSQLILTLEIACCLGVFTATGTWLIKEVLKAIKP
jgi:hypothetical protein